MKLAILDVDGTLYPDNLGIKLVQAQIAKGAFDSEIGMKIISAYKKYKRNLLSREQILEIAYRLYAKGVRGLSRAAVIKIAEDVWKQEKYKIFSFSKNLLEFLKKRHFTLVALSGSPIEIIDLLAKDLGINNVWAAKFEVKKGVYTGKLAYSPGPAIEKVKFLKRFVNGKTVDWKKSFAIGDSRSDELVMAMVGHPVAFEPHESFLPIVKKRGWLIVDRNNILHIVEKILI